MVSPKRFRIFAVTFNPKTTTMDLLEKARLVKNLCNRIKSRVHNNDCAGALLEVTQFYGLDTYTKTFKAIQAITEAQGHTPHQIVAYRGELQRELLTEMNTIDPVNAYKINSSF